MNDRTERIRDLLRGEDLAALICSRPVNVLACTGYWPVIGNSIAIVTREGEKGLLVPEDERDLVPNVTVNEIRTFKPASLDNVEPVTRTILEPLRNLITSLGAARGRLGHDTGACVEPATYVATFQFGVSLPSILELAGDARETIDLSSGLSLLRATLSELELTIVRQACSAAAAGFEAAMGRIQTGMSEREVASVLSDCISGDCTRPRSGAFAFCMSGANSAEAYRAYQLPRTRLLQENGVALLHSNSFVDGFWTDISRTYRIGTAEPRVNAVQQTVLAATRAALDKIRPGVRGREVDQAARDVLTKAGYGKEFKHATGHGVGFAAIDHNAHPRIHPKSEDVLETGMVFNVEPAAYFQGEFGVRQCNMVAVTASGYELLTDFHSDLSELRIGGT